MNKKITIKYLPQAPLLNSDHPRSDKYKDQILIWSFCDYQEEDLNNLF